LEKLSDHALSWASSLANISKDENLIIKHAGKSFLFNNGKPSVSWVKKPQVCFYAIGSYDSVELCEPIGLFILNHLGKTFGNNNISLYRDDGFAIIRNKSAHLADKSRNDFHKYFETFDLKITAEENYTCS
jgi:hypothetical protein